MADSISKEKRSWNMSRIRSADTKPEKLIRSALWKDGYRFRKNVKTLPGKPDIVFPKYKTVVFVNGCFWHRHPGCKNATMPKSNVEFWTGKFEKNVANDLKNTELLEKDGWKVITVWECELKKNLPEVVARIEKELEERFAN
mgnify:CR=1 FL=1